MSNPCPVALWVSGALLAPHPHPFLPVPSPVGAQQPESYIGYFTTACVAILLAIFSYILLPRTVRLRLLGGEPRPRSTPALAPASLHLLGHLPVALPTSDTLGLRGNEPQTQEEEKLCPSGMICCYLPAPGAGSLAGFFLHA